MRFFIIFLTAVVRLLRLVSVSGSSVLELRVWGHVRRPPDCGSASVNVVKVVVVPSTTDLAASSAASLWKIPVCDFTLPMNVVYPRSSRVRR